MQTCQFASYCVTSDHHRHGALVPIAPTVMRLPRLTSALRGSEGAGGDVQRACIHNLRLLEKRRDAPIPSSSASPSLWREVVRLEQSADASLRDAGRLFISTVRQVVGEESSAGEYSDTLTRMLEAIASCTRHGTRGIMSPFVSSFVSFEVI